MSHLALIDSVGWTLLHFLWQGALIAAVTSVGLRILRHADPRYRYNLACSALLACVLWPAAGLYLRLGGANGAQDVLALELMALGANANPSGMLAFLQNELFWIVGLWALCALALALRMALGLLWIGRAARVRTGDARLQASVQRMAARFGVTRAVRLQVLDNLASPVTVGWLRPLVLVPASLVSGMPHDLLEALLGHEMAHVKRFDYLVNLGQNVVEILLFYHPAVWWLSGRIRHEREQIADDIAAGCSGDPRALARALSELEKIQFSRHHLAQAANGGDLLARVRRLLRPDTEALNWKAAIPIVGLAAACLSLYVHAASQAALAAPEFALRLPIADFKSCVKPQYPAPDLAAGHTGTVTLGFQIGRDGRVKSAQINHSSGHPGLDQAARDAIALCRFTPGTRDGKPVASAVKVQYVWTLE